MNPITSKNYPVATDEVANLLGFHKAGVKHVEESTVSHTENTLSTVSTVSSEHLPVTDLPIVGHEAEDFKTTETNMLKNFGDKTETVAKAGVLMFVLKNVLPYIVLATIGIFSYYFFFSKLDVTKYFQKKEKIVVNTVKESALQTLEKQNSAQYSAWIKGFYFDVTDASLLDPESDNSGNGLSNFQKYLLKLNPKAYSSMGLGMADSEALAKGINPLSGGALTEDQKNVMEKYVDMEVVMNRLSLAGVNVAGARTTVNSQDTTSTFVPSNNFQAYNPYGIPNSAQMQTQPQGTAQSSEFPNSTVKNNVAGSTTVNNAPKTSPKTGASQAVVNNVGINGLEVDESIPGSLNIPSINVTVPVIFTKSTKNFTTDLQNGVVHYPGTALPGYIGTSYISGHSSNYKWAKGSYNQVFATLNDMPDNTSFSITVTQKNGKKATLHYVVTRRQEYKPTDQAQFQNSDKSVVALSTCWPVGSTAKRLVVFGEMTQMDKE